MQLLVAKDIAHLLSKWYFHQDSELIQNPPKPKPIRVLVYDPSYTTADVRLLAEIDIHVVSDPHHYLPCTENVFVMSVHVAGFVPIYTIIADLAHSTGSVPPAGFSCGIDPVYAYTREGWVSEIDFDDARTLAMWEDYTHDNLGRDEMKLTMKEKTRSVSTVFGG